MSSEADMQDQYIHGVQNAVDDALQAAMRLDDPDFFGQKKWLVWALARAKGYASQLKPVAVNDGDVLAKAPLKPGDKMQDGTIFAGISPETSKPMYTAPTDERGAHAFNDAAWHAKNNAALGHKDWRMPSKGELNVLFNNRSAIGGFDQTGRDTDGWYWSCSESDGHDAWAQRFSDGAQSHYSQYCASSLRLVRG